MTDAQPRCSAGSTPARSARRGGDRAGSTGPRGDRRQQIGAPLGLDADRAAAAILARRQRPAGRRDPPGLASRRGTTRATSCWSPSAAPGRSTRSGWRASSAIPTRAGAALARHHLRARLRAGRRPPRLRATRQPAAARGRRPAVDALLASRPGGPGAGRARGGARSNGRGRHEADLLQGQTHVLRIPIAGAGFDAAASVRSLRARATGRASTSSCRQMRACADATCARPSSGGAPAARPRPLAAGDRRAATLATPAPGRRRVCFDGGWHRHADLPPRALAAGERLDGPAHRRAARHDDRDRARRERREVDALGQPDRRACEAHGRARRSGHPGGHPERARSRWPARWTSTTRRPSFSPVISEALRPLRRHLPSDDRRGHRAGRAGAADLRRRHAVHDAGGDRARERPRPRARRRLHRQRSLLGGTHLMDVKMVEAVLLPRRGSGPTCRTPATGPTPAARCRAASPAGRPRSSRRGCGCRR